MVLYNISDLTSATKVSEVVLFANSTSNGVLFGFGLISFFVIILIALIRYDFDTVLLVDSFIMFILSGFLAYGGFVSIFFPLAFLLLMILSGLYVYMVRQ